MRDILQLFITFPLTLPFIKGRYRLQSDTFGILYIATLELERRLCGMHVGTEISYTEDLPLQDLFVFIDHHYQVASVCFLALSLSLSLSLCVCVCAPILSLLFPFLLIFAAPGVLNSLIFLCHSFSIYLFHIILFYFSLMNRVGNSWQLSAASTKSECPCENRGASQVLPCCAEAPANRFQRQHTHTTGGMHPIDLPILSV